MDVLKNLNHGDTGEEKVASMQVAGLQVNSPATCHLLPATCYLLPFLCVLRVSVLKNFFAVHPLLMTDH